MFHRSVKRKRVAVALVAAAIIVPLAVLSPNWNRNEGGCVGKRWPVKTLADPAGRRLRLDRVQATTIEALRHDPFRPGGQSSRGGIVERTVYRVAAVLVLTAGIGFVCGAYYAAAQIRHKFGGGS